MYTKIDAVALRTIKYSDRTNILAVWSQQLGRLSLALNAGSGAESRRRRALTMPMSLIEVWVDVRPGRDIHNIRDLRAAAVTPSLAADPVKAAIAMFMAEVLGVTLSESAGEDAATWNFIRPAVTNLDQCRSARALANYPLWFLYGLCVLTGIEPDFASYRPGSVLDLQEGIFRTAAPLHSRYLTPDESRFSTILPRLTVRHLAHVALDSATRQRTMDMLILYFGMHQKNLNNLKTLPILHTLLRG